MQALHQVVLIVSDVTVTYNLPGNSKLYNHNIDPVDTLQEMICISDR